jgi:NAD(P)H-hydrate repair Nnr-like enzyme with NAD(P)H-hydrate dehydratase domain
MSSSGNPGLASAGMGDALIGMIAALMGQGLSAEHAMLSAVNLHRAAADHCVANGAGPIGLTASEVIDAARQVINAWFGHCRPRMPLGHGNPVSVVKANGFPV